MQTSAPIDDQGPIFYVGHHDTKRSEPVTDAVLNLAQDCGYDMLTAPITTSQFHSRTLALLSSHLAQEDASNLPVPIIPPFTPTDTHLAPSPSVSQMLAVTSTWTDLCSPDPLIASISRQILHLEIGYAAFCGVGNVIIPGPRLRAPRRDARGLDDGLHRYARAILEALSIGGYLSIQISLPMIYQADAEPEEDIGSLASMARDQYLQVSEARDAPKTDSFGTWDAWNMIRNLCNYSPRLFVALSIPRHLPAQSVQDRWFSEPLRLLSFHLNTFLLNKNNYPVLSKPQQALINRYMRLRTCPWILLTDVGELRSPNGDPPDGYLSPSMTADAGSLRSPTPAEAKDLCKGNSKKKKDYTPHLSYIRHLQRTQPTNTTIERFSAGYQDFLQAPLQPLTDNLESVTYEVFEKDPIKYDWYERAIAKALQEWGWDDASNRSGSGPRGEVVIAVVGAGRGPLVSRALNARDATGVDIDLWAVEKNPNAYVLLQRHNQEKWAGHVSVVKSDMRAWPGPSRWSNSKGKQVLGKVDIIVSELLGSFADNELSPECLDGVQHVLHPHRGISIPSSYTAHLTPISAPRLHTDIHARIANDATAPETPYVVMLHAIDYLSTTGPALTPLIKQAWEFRHPASRATLEQAQLRRSGGVSGGGGGQMAGSDGANEHNSRFANLSFPCANRGVCNGLGGYFETVLYGDIELSTNPETMDAKSKDMISWFPIFFPLKKPLYFPDSSELEVSIWRQTDDRKVWYEWLVEAFAIIGGQRVRLGCSDLHSSRKNGCLM